jgi:hypothetical protein
MKTLVISPFSRVLINGKKNPKNYAHWGKVIPVLKEKYHLIQIGIEGEEDLGCHEFRKSASFSDIRLLISKSDGWLCVETFLMHMGHLLGKRGVVIWHVCRPDLYGYTENINLVKDKKYFRPNQFDLFEDTPYNEEAHVAPKKVIEAVNTLLS